MSTLNQTEKAQGKPEYTPGPWYLEKREYKAGTSYDITASPGNGWKGGRYMCVGGIIEEEDARLIAAAPDLLEALKYARRFLMPAEHDCAFVDAAIAKAEGRA